MFFVCRDLRFTHSFVSFVCVRSSRAPLPEPSYNSTNSSHFHFTASFILVLMKISGRLKSRHRITHWPACPYGQQWAYDGHTYRMVANKWTECVTLPNHNRIYKLMIIFWLPAMQISKEYYKSDECAVLPFRNSTFSVFLIPLWCLFMALLDGIRRPNCIWAIGRAHKIYLMSPPIRWTWCPWELYRTVYAVHLYAKWIWLLLWIKVRYFNGWRAILDVICFCRRMNGRWMLILEKCRNAEKQKCVMDSINSTI